MGREDDEEREESSDDIDPDDVPTMVMPAVADPFERARLALRSARMARGMDPDAPDPEAQVTPLPKDPIERANAVLERAAATREEATRGKLALEREARAKEELAELKKPRGRGKKAAAADSPADATPAGDDEGPKPRKRRL